MKRKSPFSLVLSSILLLSAIAPILSGNASAQEDWGLFFGQLNAHTSLSDGTLTVQEAFQAASQVPGLDFFAVTDHSNDFDNWENASIGEDAASVSADWAEGKAAAEAVTDGDFVGIFGYEMTWQGEKLLGHMSTFATPGFQTRDQAAYRDWENALPNYYDTLCSFPGAIGQFNHPGSLYGDFQDLEHYSERRDSAISLLEIGSGTDAFFYYDRALDKGWHIAPTNSGHSRFSQLGEGGRTAVLARSLTEEDIYDALRNRRVYATEDPDLEIFYTLSGHVMGSLLERRQVGELVEVRVDFRDPTDEEAGTIEVIVDGGTVAAGCTVSGSGGTLTFTLPPVYSYYYIRVTQPDGEQAVTAPVWVDQTEDAGISDFFADTALPRQNRETALILALYNDESDPLVIEAMDFTIDGEIIHSSVDDLRIGPGETGQYTFSYVHTGLGKAEITASVTASLGGEARSYTETLALTFRAAEMVSGILVDGAHGNAGLDSLERFTALAAECQQEVTVVTAWTAELLENANILVVTAPGEPFSEEFLALAARFVQWGGSLVVCGQGDALDGSVHSSQQLNRLLEAAGSGLRLRDDTARDPKENLGLETDLAPEDFNEESHWYVPALENRVYRQSLGCTVEGGTWLVRGPGTTLSRDGDGDGGSGSGNTVLAWERGSGGGDILAAGGLFLADEFLAVPESIWKEPYANRVFAEKLLGLRQEQLSLTRIAQVRTGTEGKAYRIRGWITAGNSGINGAFKNILYVQDDSGGIGIASFTETDIPVGTPVEIVGALSSDGRNPVLETISFEILEEDAYSPQPVIGGFRRVMDNSLHGGELVQAEGEVVEVNTEEGILTDFLLRDSQGNYATVSIDSTIRSGSTGKNTLADTVRLGREVRAAGILYLRDDGTAAIRVRDCDEVVLLSDWPYADTPYADPTNPPTGDGILPLFAALPVTLVAAVLWKKKKR